MNKTRLRWTWACTWRFALAGPPIGTAMFLLPTTLLQSGPPATSHELLGSWLFFSLFGYLFAGASATAAGAFYGLLKYQSAHHSRWRLGLLSGALGWLVQITAFAIWDQDVWELDSILLLPIALAAGSLCGRLFDPCRLPGLQPTREPE